ncbi:hypothetical protein [Lutimaribacter saemankumensis]|uniref:Uncharacterized protein n=1 Tax=Lutimaribacter saemankumensis TaxID=490829 RepID=A0A1G8RHY4_9RHOB|nr:hypothetical protein [Lutimaribacter saemankumensis]SDJ16607.1 hypothetical protein SAMN05421850_109131 [Lutimaribacter saemankumensis]
MPTRFNTTAAFSIIICAFTTGTAVFADEAGDIKACQEIFAKATGRNLDKDSAVWEAYIFSPNEVEFPQNNVICKVNYEGVYFLSEKGQIIILDGWPVGNEELFKRLVEQINGKVGLLEDQIDKYKELMQAGEVSLRQPGGEPKQRLAEFEAKISTLFFELISTDTNYENVAINNLKSEIAACQTKRDSVEAELKECKNQVNAAEKSNQKVLDFQDNMRDLEVAIRDKEFEKARNILVAEVKIDSLREYKLAELESATLAMVKPLPASETKLNMDGYRLLTILDFENSEYRQKYNQYSAIYNQLSTIQEEKGPSTQTSSDMGPYTSEEICKALIVATMSATSLDDVKLSSASNFSNPYSFKDVYLAEYRRAADGKIFRVLCGINSSEATFSILWDYEPGRTQYEWEKNKRISYRTANGKVTFTETYFDGSKLDTTVTLK